MKSIILIFSLLVIVGCNSEDQYYDIHTTRVICTDDTIEKRSDFTLQCIENANPKSDEEPEDWLYKCENMAEKLYCKNKPVIVHYIQQAGNSYRTEIGTTIK